RVGYNKLIPEKLSPEWLLIEWPEGEAEPTKYWLSTLPENVSFTQLVDLAKLRWRIERDYQELKQEVGLGHYEGRGWRGFHHHAVRLIRPTDYESSKTRTEASLPPFFISRSPRNFIPAVPTRARAGCRRARSRRRGGCAAPRGRGRRARLRRATVRTRRCSG